MDDEVTGGAVVVRVLKSLGIRHIFGVPGGQTLAITDAILDEPMIQFITARHEGAAAVMADAYGRLTGTPGVCLATTGPGATNMLTGVGGALRDSSPVLAITCNNAGPNIYKDDAQNADHVAIFRTLTKWSRLVGHGSGVKQALEEAYVQAMTGNPGPVLLDFARDALESTVPPPVVPGIHPARSWVTRRPCADSVSVAEAADAIRTAARPVFWIGNGCNRGMAGEAVLALAESTQIPIITTFNGIGAVPTTHPLVFGALSRMGTNLSRRVLDEADLVIAVGNSLNAVSTARWTMALPRIVHLDIDPTVVGRYYGDQTIGLVGDARASISALAALLDAQVCNPSVVEGRREWIADLTEHARAWWRTTEPAGTNSVASLDPSDHWLASPAEVVRCLRRVAPDDTLLIADAGNPGVWSFLWEVRRSGSYMKPVGFGNMGFAVPAAAAAAVVNPRRPVLALVGDGSLGMSLAELETLARVGGRVAIVVFNDSGYGNIRQEEILHYGRTIGVDFGPADYATVSEGLGVRGKRVCGFRELMDLVQETLSGDAPRLFDVPIDPAVSAWTHKAFANYAGADD